MESQGHSCLSLVVETVDWLLVLSESESGLVDGQEHGLSYELCDEILVVGDEGSKDVSVLSSGVGYNVPLRETRSASNLSKHNSAGGSGPEMGLEWALDGFVRGGLV